MSKLTVIIFTAMIALAGLAGSVTAQTALKDVPRIRDGLISVGMAYEISENCGSLRARTLRGIGFLSSLKSHAEDLGFSDDEIDAYVNNKAEQDRLEGIARSQLAALGVVPGDESSYCTVGRAQIAANTRVGWLLR